MPKLNDLRPYRQLLALGADFPGVWDKAESLILRKPHPDGREIPTWPEWCLLPMGGWDAILPAADEAAYPLIVKATDVAILSAIGSWRYSQGYYAFDADVYAALTSAPLSGDIPCAALYRLPEWCVYIVTPGLAFDGALAHGAYVHLEHDVNRAESELRVLLDCENGFLPIILHLGQWTVAEGVERMVKHAYRMKQYHEIAVADTPEARDKGVALIKKAIDVILPLVLYLCSDAPEVEDGREPGVSPHRNRPQRTKRGKRIFVPQRPRIWDVGKPTGDRLRRAVAEHVTRHGVHPHIRRAHWHGFWSGPMDGERKFSYKWLPPMIVGDGQEERS